MLTAATTGQANAGDRRANPEARIGPNAIIRVAEALPGHVGPAAARAVFEAADLAAYWERPPAGMVAEAEVTRLQQTLRDQLGVEAARQVSWDAGLLTADYLLAVRIPKPAQRLLKPMPARWASQVLLAAVKKNAWTFAGTGEFTAQGGRPSRVAIAGCCLCRGAEASVPLCDFYAASFERLFRVLVTPRARAVEVACQALGADACRFEIDW